MDKRDNLRRAIDVMTAWTDDPDNLDFAGQRLRANMAEAPDADGHDGEMKLMFGLITLAGGLLVRLEETTGETMQWHLQDIAKRSLR